MWHSQPMPPAVQKEVLDKEKAIKSGRFAIFGGPMKDRHGKERIAAGQKLDTNSKVSKDINRTNLPTASDIRLIIWKSRAKA
jgi:hypothetical protein